ncbi:hypothetical protein BKA70DRAFT_1541550 [Coprinopsis sp. MPI-PUGE-AT-0042]|nr:hypothetical protein BKA70DRAFT_1541550 [Coprinopsis sp. MPI-PUGE-AT-0042]
MVVKKECFRAWRDSCPHWALSGFPGSFGLRVYEGVVSAKQNREQHRTIRTYYLQPSLLHTNLPRPPQCHPHSRLIETPLTPSSHTPNLAARPHLTLADRSYAGSPSPPSSSQNPLIVDTGSLEQTWGKVKQQVPWMNNRPLPAPPPIPDVNLRGRTLGIGTMRTEGTSCCLPAVADSKGSTDVLEDGADFGEEDVYEPYRRLRPLFLNHHPIPRRLPLRIREKLPLTLADDIEMQLLPAFKTTLGLPARITMAVTAARQQNLVPSTLLSSMKIMDGRCIASSRLHDRCVDKGRQGFPNDVCLPYLTGPPSPPPWRSPMSIQPCLSSPILKPFSRLRLMKLGEYHPS